MVHSRREVILVESRLVGVAVMWVVVNVASVVVVVVVVVDVDVVAQIFESQHADSCWGNVIDVVISENHYFQSI